MKKTLIKILGVPGCRKSTMLREVDRILRCHNRSIIIVKDKLYTTDDLAELKLNPWQNAVIFQQNMIDDFQSEDKYQQQMKKCENQIVVEHTPIEMIEFFTAAYKLSGFITDYGFKYIRNKWYNSSINDDADKCGYIYVICSPKDSIENMKERKREGEGTVYPFVLDTINHFILAHHDSNKSDFKLVLYYRENDFHTGELYAFLTACMNI